MKHLILAVVCSLALTTTVQAQWNPDWGPGADKGNQQAVFQQEGENTGGSGATGCQYCYTNYAPYGNCFTSSMSQPYPKYSSCQGVRFCWRTATESYCEPGCQGSMCYEA